jgi:hypothetical protein
MTLLLASLGGLGRGLRPKDPYFHLVAALLHAESPPGSTTGFVDHSAYRHSVTGGNANSTTIAFGSSSTAYADMADHSAFTLGTSDFTVDCWFRFNGTGTQYFLAGQLDSGAANTSISFLVQRTAANKIRAFCCSGASVIGDITGTTSVTTGTPYFVRYGRTGSSFALYLNTASEGTASSSASVNDSANKLAVGRGGEYTGVPLNGYWDDFRLTVGLWRGAPSAVPSNPFADR